MKKLLAIITMTLLLCSVLSTSLFAAVQTGPSIIGPAGITAAGYLLSGEIGDFQVKYDTKLPLGEIKTNIKAAPSPDGKVKAVEENFEYSIILGEEAVSGFDLDTLIADYDADSAIVENAKEWIVAEKDGELELQPYELFVVLTDDAIVNVMFNYTEDVLDVEILEGITYAVYSFIGEIEDFDIVSVALDIYVDAYEYYLDLGFVGTLQFTLTIIVPDDEDSIILEIVLA